MPKTNCKTKAAGFGSTEQKNSLVLMTAFSRNLDLTSATDRALKAIKFLTREECLSSMSESESASDESAASDVAQFVRYRGTRGGQSVV